MNHAVKCEHSRRAVVLIEPDVSVRDALTLLLEGENWRVICVNGCEDLLGAIRENSVLAVITESSLPNCSPEEILEHCFRHKLPVIFTGHDLSLQGAVDLIRQGASDFLDKPFPQSRLLDLLEGLKNRQNS